MLTIAWDVDDVLNNLMREWFYKKWLAEHSCCRPRFKEIVENPPDRLLGISKEDYFTSLDNFRVSGLFSKMKPVPEVKKWFLKYGNNFHHIVITAVPVRAASISAGWVLSNFGRWIRTFHFIPSFRKGEKIFSYDKNKKDYLLRMGKADIFIDDNEVNMRGIEKLGIRCILFPRPWNSSKLSVAETLKIIGK